MNFKDAIRYCEPARSKDEFRENLTWFLTVDGCVVTTDGHRLHIAVVDDVDLSERRVFRADSIELIARGTPIETVGAVPDDHYPAVGQIVQSAFGCSPTGRRIKVVAKELHEAIRQVMPEKPKKEKRLTAGDPVRKPRRKRSEPRPPVPTITIEFLEDEIEVCGPFIDDSAQRKARRVYAYNVEGGNCLRMIFNAKYLLAALKGMGGEIELTVNEDVAPMAIETTEQRAIVMPMRA